MTQNMTLLDDSEMYKRFLIIKVSESISMMDTFLYLKLKTNESQRATFANGSELSQQQ